MHTVSVAGKSLVMKHAYITSKQYQHKDNGIVLIWVRFHHSVDKKCERNVGVEYIYINKEKKTLDKFVVT